VVLPPGKRYWNGWNVRLQTWRLDPVICMGEEVIFLPAQKCPYHVTFDLDLEHTLDARWPGVHRVQVWWRSGHLPARIDVGCKFTRIQYIVYKLIAIPLAAAIAGGRSNNTWTIIYTPIMGISLSTHRTALYWLNTFLSEGSRVEITLRTLKHTKKLTILDWKYCLVRMMP